MRLRPITQREAFRFIAAHHRHNEAPPNACFCVAVVENDLIKVHGVGVAGRPPDKPDWMLTKKAEADVIVGPTPHAPGCP